MKDFEEILSAYDKSPEELEGDLLKTLQNINSRAPLRILDTQYYYTRVDYLYQNGFILRDKKDEVTQKGEFALKRGWVHLNIREYKKQKRKELWRRIIPHLLQVASILVAIVLGILGLFFPRKSLSDVSGNIKNVIPHVENSIADTMPQIDEISQTADSTKQQNDSCKGK